MKIDQLFNVKNKVVLITGSSRGIGAALAKGFSLNGAKVYIHGRKEEATKDAAIALGIEDYVYGDLANDAEVNKIIETIKKRESKLDVLINNAGYEGDQAIDGADMDIVDTVYKVNTRSPFVFISEFSDLLKAANGASVINITSIHDHTPVRKNSAYCMSKASMAMMTKVAALEYGKYNIRFNNIAPGAIYTDMNRQLIADLEDSMGVHFGDWVPLERVGEAKEIVGPAIFLASDASSYMTATTIYVDGGYMENLLRY